MEFVQVDVFADGPYLGNPLAVFPGAEGLARSQMQTIAREMNLSETTFVTAARDDTFRIRIFTPVEELPFAGHPTIGTAWVLLDLGRVQGNELVQQSDAGSTRIVATDDTISFERAGTVGPDIEDRDPQFHDQIATALGLSPREVGLEARELGRPGRLVPAVADAGLPQLMVPLRDLAALARCRPSGALLSDLGHNGAYCFTATQAGRIRARGFWPGLGIAEDPATGSAAAGLGLYLSARVAPIEFEIAQGVEMHRPARIRVWADRERVTVGGACHLVMTGELQNLP